jgi:hypothetical protein
MPAKRSLLDFLDGAYNLGNSQAIIDHKIINNKNMSK